jgi:hypothetical protein
MKKSHAVQIFILSCMAFLLGCAHTYSLPPMYEDFVSIHNEPYVLGVNDCSNKTVKYTRILRENGYAAHMLSLYNQKDEYGHSVVVVFDQYGNTTYYCPTDLRWGRSLKRRIHKKYPERWIHLYEDRHEDPDYKEYTGEEK